MGGRADPQDVSVIDGWYEEAKRLMLLKSLAEHDGVKYVIEIFENEVKKINEQLLSADSIKFDDWERDRALDKRNLAEKYLNLFKNVDNDLAKIEEQVDKEV